MLHRMTGAIAPLPLGTLILFAVGTPLLILGMGLFTLGEHQREAHLKEDAQECEHQKHADAKRDRQNQGHVWDRRFSIASVPSFWYTKFIYPKSLIEGGYDEQKPMAQNQGVDLLGAADQRGRKK